MRLATIQWSPSQMSRQAHRMLKSAGTSSSPSTTLQHQDIGGTSTGAVPIPSVHQFLPLIKESGASVGGLHLIGNDVSQCGLGHEIRRVRAFRRPIFERGLEAMRRDSGTQFLGNYRTYMNHIA